MEARDVRQALVLQRWRYPLGGWPWRTAAYLASGVVVGALACAALLVLLLASLLLVGIPLLLLGGVALGGAERARLRLVDRLPAADPHRVPAAPGLGAWARLRAGERATWRELAYVLLLATVLWPLDAVVLALAVGAPGTLLAAPVLLAADGHETKLLKTVLVTTYPAAFAAAAVGALALLALTCPLGCTPPGAAGSPGRCSRPGSGTGSARSSPPGPGSWTPSRPSAAGSSATSTTAPSTGWSRSP